MRRNDENDRNGDVLLKDTIHHVKGRKLLSLSYFSDTKRKEQIYGAIEPHTGQILCSRGHVRKRMKAEV